MQYKVLICDVDGTLVPNKINGRPSARVKKALEKAKEKLFIGIATARSFTLAKHILDEISWTAPCVLTGGAQIYDPRHNTFYSEKCLALKEVSQIFAVANDMRIKLIIADERGESSLTSSYVVKKAFDVYTESLSEQKADSFMKALSFLENISVHKSLSWEGDGMVHVSVGHPEATKQHGILEIAKILGVSTHEIIGIGEGYNDFPLLMACGLKVAMGNAVADVKAIADYIAPSVAEDGVADVIEKFIL
jgi:HAD superfamily hydrolase (TIGR01484 family)